ncbi:MAG: bacteriohemerythrin [Endomicrobium sp.]|nr:bacteriohemerythrin [Endomicrobium sp.]
MAYEWSSDLETGNEIIDSQHKGLFSALNKLVEAQHRREGAQELNKTIEFLTAYVIQHFADEEKLQEEYNYPDKFNHKSYHNDFKRTVKELVEKLNVEGYSDVLLEHTIQIMADWLINHIKSDDFRLAAYVQLVKGRGKE